VPFREEESPVGYARSAMSDFTDQPSAMREGQGIDAAALGDWLAKNLPEYAAKAGGEVAIEQFGRGYSNLTYLVKSGTRELVLRRAPPGVKIKSAHDMGREFRILSALARVPGWTKTPRPLAACEDESVLGSQFYVMERVRGVILRAKPPKGLVLSPEVMRRVSEATIDTLAEIHTLDWRAAGLEGIGKPDGYVRRQVEGWTERYRKAQTDDVPQFEELGRWLFAHLPADSAPALIHNDFKYDNIVFDERLDEGLARVVSVLDWEMATVGDPLMDLGTTLGYWIEPDDPPVFQLTVFGPTNLPGNLRRSELVARYAEKTGRDVGDVLFYYANALYKLAVVAQQLYKRWKDGLTNEDRYSVMLAGVQAVTSAALVAIDKGRIDRLGE
jgi:aminoglycoside phosphotransferase (APT) family kinase protein